MMTLPTSSAEAEAVAVAAQRMPCEECGDQAWKYRCPRCDTKTCSLPCSRAHKTRLDCSGKRNKAEFVRLDQFDTSVLHSDFNFLEEITCCADSCKVRGEIEWMDGWMDK